MIAPLLDLAERAHVADTSLEAWAQILPTLTAREVEVFLLVSRYVEETIYADVTGTELSTWSGKLVTSIRPRLTGLVKKGWLHSGPTRASRAKLEGRCHPVFPALPRSAIERLSLTVNKIIDGALTDR